jgi:hypothetical protein
MDVRGALIAVAGLLFAAVLGALLATDPRLIAVVALLGAAALVSAGVVSLPAVQRRYPRLRPPASRDAAMLRRLGDGIRTCQKFRLEVQALTVETDQIADIRERSEAWAVGVRDYLDAERPGWGAIFMSNRIAVQFSSVGRVERSRLDNYLEQREAALRALMEQLP